MNLTNIATLKRLCKELNIWPSKKLGQNFLINNNILDKIIKAGGLSAQDNVIEIGPGFGVLTMELLKYIKNLIIIEKDKKLAEFLEKEIDGRIKIIINDILKISNFQFPISKQIPNSKFQILNYKIISNLPYQITSPVLWKFLHYEEKHKPEIMVLMVQKEVAERIIAKPGKMSVLSVMCQFYADCELISLVSRENFWPEPDVDSAIIKLKLQAPSSNNQKNTKHQTPNIKIFNTKYFFKLVKIGFSAKRKMLKNNLSAGLQIPSQDIEKILQDIKLNKKIRAQELSVKDWVELYREIKEIEKREKRL